MTTVARPTRRTGRTAVLGAAAVGVVAGFLSGLFGVGGGILIVPALVLVLGFEQRLAHGTSLSAVLPISAAGLIGFAVEGKVDWRAGVCLAVGAVAGALIGTSLLRRLDTRVLALGFAVLLVATAVRMVLDDPAGADGRATLSVLGVLALVAVGVASGVLAGLLGVGGGIILVPAMIVLFGIPAAAAKGTSLAVIIPTSLMGTWRNLRHRNTDLRVAAAVGLAGVASAYGASKISVRLDEQLANRLFAGLLVVIAVRMVWALYRERRNAAHMEI